MLIKLNREGEPLLYIESEAVLAVAGNRVFLQTGGQPAAFEADPKTLHFLFTQILQHVDVHKVIDKQGKPASETVIDVQAVPVSNPDPSSVIDLHGIEQEIREKLTGLLGQPPTDEQMKFALDQVLNAGKTTNETKPGKVIPFPTNINPN